MKILSLSTLFPTSTMPNHGVFVKNRLCAMASISGVDLTVINPIPTSFVHKLLPNYKKQQSSSLISNDENLGIVEHPRYFSLPGVLKDKEHIGLIRGVKKRLNELHSLKKFEHIDIHWAYPDLLLGIELAKEWGITCSVTLRGMETFYISDKDNRTNLIADALKKTDCVISLSEEMSIYADKIAGTKNKTKVITNGVDTSLFSYKNRLQLRKLLCIPEDELVILGIGSLIERKGFHNVISALEYVNTPKRIRYVIIGSPGLEGNFEKSLKELAKNVEIKSNGRIRVQFKDQIHNSMLPSWYNVADIFCLSSYGEGSPNVLTEAISCGCPVVATNVGSVESLVNRIKDKTLYNKDNKRLFSENRSAGIVINNPSISPSGQSIKELSRGINHCINTLCDDKAREENSSILRQCTWEWCAKNAFDFICKTIRD